MANKNLIIDSDWEMDQKLVALLMCTAQEMSAEITRNLRQFNLSFIQLQILHVLSESEEGLLTVNQIKNLMIDDSPNVSRALNKLMDSRHVIKERSKTDQRIVYIEITASGRKMHEDADREIVKTELKLSSAEKEKLYDILIKV